MHVHNLPRLNAHSSAADFSFDLNQPDPLIRFGLELVDRGVLNDTDIMKRHDRGQTKDFFDHHDFGTILTEINEELRALIEMVRAEPDPPVDSIHENIMAPFPDVSEPTWEDPPLRSPTGSNPCCNRPYYDAA